MRQLAQNILLTMLFLVGLLPSNGVSHASSQPDSLPLKEAIRLTTDAQKRLQIYRDLKGGDSLLRLSMAADSLYGPAYYNMAQMLSSQRANTDSVIYYAQKAYMRDTTNKWYAELYAQSLAVGGQFKRSRDLYLAAIEREPQNATPYIMAAMLYRETEEPEKALSLLDSAEMRVGKSNYISSLKRDLLLATGQSERAIEEAKELILLEPQDIESRISLANLYITTKQDSLAQRELEAALEVDPTSLKLLDALTKYYADRGDMSGYFATMRLIFANPAESVDNKISTFKRITSDRNFYSKNLVGVNTLATQLYLLNPTNEDVIELYTDHLIASGNLDKALEVFKFHAENTTPPAYDYWTTVIDIESYLQRVDSVEMYAARAIEIFPDRHELRLSQARLYSYTKRYTQANKLYSEQLDKVQSDSLKGWIWGAIGDNYHQMSLEYKVGSSKSKSLMRKAYKAYDSSLKRYPANAMVLNNYAYFLSLERRDLGDALDMSGRAIALEPGNPTYLDTYAWVLYELGRYDEAKKIMRQVIALDTSESADIQFHYAEILAALGEDFMAGIYYDKALKLGFDEAVIENKKAKLK